MKDVLRRSASENRIREFMRKAGQATPDKPTIPDEATRILRAKLILEEALETIRGLGVSIKVYEPPAGYDSGGVVERLESAELKFFISGEVNLAEVIDGVADLQVVGLGTAISCGVAMEAVQELVDESNLAKFEPPKCPTCDRPMVLENNHWSCLTSSAHPALPKEAGPYRREDGKHIKPPYWKKPDIEGLLKEQTMQADYQAVWRRRNENLAENKDLQQDK